MPTTRPRTSLLLLIVATVMTALGGRGIAQEFSTEDLARRTIHRRAVEAVIWGMPAVNAERMFAAMKDAKADFN